MRDWIKITLLYIRFSKKNNLCINFPKFFNLSIQGVVHMSFIGNKKIGAFISSLSFVLICLALITHGCKKEKRVTPSSPPLALTISVSPADVPVSFEYVAQTESSHLVNIQARVSGFLDKRLYTEGAVVKEGQVLFQMDDKPFKAQLNQAKAVLLQQEAALETARLNLNRVKPLVEQNALSQKDLDEATGQYQSAAAAVEQAKAQVETQKLNLSYTTITSPITGISGSAQQADGTYISQQNSLLTTVEALSPIWVNFSLSENEMQRYRDQVAKGLLLPPKDHSYEVEVLLVDGSVFPHKGWITFAEPSYNVQTGTFLIRTSVDNPEGVLRSNQYVHVRLKGAIRPHAILIPQRAVVQGSKGQYVWTVNKDNTVEQRPVTVGGWHEDQWFILEGLKASDQVLVDGSLLLQPGMKVTVKPYDEKAKPVTVGASKADA
jgi:membrane fusion protein (multidrug efflux system)